MSHGACYCNTDTGRLCPRHQSAIDAAEDGPLFDPVAADREADRFYESLQKGRMW